MVFIGAYAAHGQKFKVFDASLPQYLTAPVFIGICIALAKVMVALLSLPLTRGLLPNSMNPLLDPALNERIDDGLDYQDALAFALTALIEERMHESVAILRYLTSTDEEFVSEFIPVMIRLLDIQLNELGIPTKFLVDKPDIVQERSQSSYLDYDSFVKVCTAAKTFQHQFWNTGAACPFYVWGQVYIVVMHAEKVVPPNFLPRLVEGWTTVIELPYIKERHLTNQFVLNRGINNREQAEAYLAQVIQ